MFIIITKAILKENTTLSSFIFSATNNSLIESNNLNIINVILLISKRS